MNYFTRCFLCLCSIHLVLAEQVATVDNRCFTSSGSPGICKTHQQCIASQSSAGDGSPKTELFSETCRIENDGTPVICCVLTTHSSNQKDNDTYTYVEPESSQNSSKQSGTGDTESRFFNGPRKRQYYNYNVVPYRPPASNNLIPQYEPVSYNDVSYSYQHKKNNNQQNVNHNSFAFEPSSVQANQQYMNGRPQSNTNYNTNYNTYNNNPSRNPTSRPSASNSYNPSSSWQSQSYLQQPTRRPSVDDPIIFKQTGSGSSRLSTVTNRYNSNSDDWPTQTTQRRQDVHPVWGEVPESTTTSRVIRTPRPTESYQNQNQFNSNQNQNQFNPNQNQNQYNQNQYNQNQNQNQYNQNQNQNQYNQNQNQNQFNQNSNRPTQQNQNGNQDVNRPSTQQNYNQNSNRPTLPKRISEEKCSEYSKIVTDKVSALPLSITTHVQTKETENCPVEAVELIVGGSKAALGEFPHMAALGFRRGSAIEYNCGGSLISEEHVLTAAHCIKSALGDPIHVRLGDLNLESDNDGADPQVIGIQQIFVHPQYKTPQLYHDIAVIKLSRRVLFDKMLRPACLYPVYDIGVQKVRATGWGSTAYGETSSDELRKVALDIIDNKQCTSLYGTDTKLKNGITNDMLCAGELSGNKDTCQGDSGGPLQIKSPKNRCIHYVIGITSFGRSCGVANSAGIYTRVSQYIDWIESVVWH